MGLSGVIFMMAFATGCILALARHPIFGLMTYVGVFYVHPPSRWWGVGVPQLRWSLIASGVTLLAIMLSKENKPKLKASLNNKVIIGIGLFLAWMLIQAMWALNPDQHWELIGLVAKYGLLVVLIYVCVDTEENMRLFLWSHVVGCFYLGWIVFTEYDGGRFEGFGGPNINEANAGALQIVTSVFVAAALFLWGRWREKIALLGLLPFMVNALIATVSRSGFLAAALGGIIFNLFTPKRFRTRTRVLTILAGLLFVMLTNPMYWMRISSIKYTGEDVQGVDTGAGRLVLLQAQWKMFLEYPLGCGHRCTATLSRNYLPDSDLTGEEGNRARSSHSTVMTMVTEHGIPGAFFYFLQIVWVYTAVRKLAKNPAITEHPFYSCLLPAAAAAMGAIFLQDEFVDDLRLEVRFWFMAILLVLLNKAAQWVPQTVPKGTLKRGARKAPGARETALGSQ